MIILLKCITMATNSLSFFFLCCMQLALTHNEVEEEFAYIQSWHHHGMLKQLRSSHLLVFPAPHSPSSTICTIWYSGGGSGYRRLKTLKTFLILWKQAIELSTPTDLPRRISVHGWNKLLNKLTRRHGIPAHLIYLTEDIRLREVKSMLLTCWLEGSFKCAPTVEEYQRILVLRIHMGCWKLEYFRT